MTEHHRRPSELIGCNARPERGASAVREGTRQRRKRHVHSSRGLGDVSQDPISPDDLRTLLHAPTLPASRRPPPVVNSTVITMRRSHVLNNYLTPSLVVGTLLSIATALLLLMFDITDLGISFVVGISGMSLSAALDLIDRSEYASIFKAPSWLRGEVARLGELSQDVLALNITVLEDELRSIVSAAVREAEAVASGRLERNEADARHLLDLAACAKTRIAATTNIAGPGGSSRLEWWDSEFGRRYWLANKAAIARGVKIDRVFIYEALDQRLLDFVESQCAAGVNACLIDVNTVIASHRTNLAVFDDTCAWEARMDAYGHVTRNIFCYHTVDVKHRLVQVDSLLVQARSGQAPSD